MLEGIRLMRGFTRTRPSDAFEKMFDQKAANMRTTQTQPRLFGWQYVNTRLTGDARETGRPRRSRRPTNQPRRTSP